MAKPLVVGVRRELRSVWRGLGCFKQAPLVLAHLRKNETSAQAGAGFGVCEATAWRYVHESVEVLASWVPRLHEALAGPDEGDFVILDGTLVPTHRIKADEPYYSQKHKKHGMNVQVITRPDGTQPWFSRATPGRTHDLTAARAHGHRPGLPRPPDPRPGRPRISGCRRHDPHPLLRT
ncbi:hypothetical protein GCM10010339_92030 [Streptomyces alanosinicus]|uniref:Transposase n=1 Tax=Streptomyces alanosinicus TaxID=68171 RepID=A0A918YUL7_9ACTN|nr:hypothetical protein GCM10010339_92030 [Streptomyces alanosinicus]